MSTIIEWITSNWAFILLTFGGEALTVGGVAWLVIKLVLKRASQKSNEIQSTAVVSTLRMLHGSLQFLQNSIELIINNSGSETIRAKYSKLKSEAETAEQAINELLDKLFNVAPELVDATVSKAQQTISVLKEVAGVDTNQAIL